MVNKKNTIKGELKGWRWLVGAFCFVLLFFIVLFSVALVRFSANSLAESYEAIEGVIKKEYKGYEINGINLSYVDFYSTVTEADENHPATRATAVVKNGEEAITVRFEKVFNLFGSPWVIVSSIPEYGPNVQNDVYFIEMDYRSVGKAVDIEEYISADGRWVIPDEDGNLYTKHGEPDWYYSVGLCRNIYKTKDGDVYVFDKDISDWKKADKRYSDLVYLGNYREITKEYALSIIEKYSSYRE